MTYDQKFILLLTADVFFKQECEFMIDKWLLNRGQEKRFASIEESERSKLPLEYRTDIRFIMHQSRLPERFFWPLHTFLVTKEVPKIENLPPHLRILTSFPSLTNMGKISIEIDLDAGKEEIESVIPEVYETKQLLQKMDNADKKSQPIREFDDLLKVLKNRGFVHEYAEDAADWNQERTVVKRKISGVKNRLRAKLSRTIRNLSKHKRTSVEKREQLEALHRKWDKEGGW